MKLVHLFPEHNTAILYEPADDGVIVTNGTEEYRFYGTFRLLFDSKTEYRIINKRDEIVIYDQIKNSHVKTYRKERII